MPIYEFECGQCGEMFETVQAYEASVRCPKCGSGDVSRLISRTTFQLRGEGWSKDGYQHSKEAK